MEDLLKMAIGALVAALAAVCGTLKVQTMRGANRASERDTLADKRDVVATQREALADVRDVRAALIPQVCAKHPCLELQIHGIIQAQKEDKEDNRAWRKEMREDIKGISSRLDVLITEKGA